MAAFIAMCVGTLQMMLTAEKVFSFTEYSSIFQYFSESGKKIDTRKPEVLLVQRSVLPCVTFGVSFCITLLTFYLAHQNVIPNEVMCTVSAFFTLAVFFQFECYKSTLLLVSSSSRLLSWLYVFLIVFRDIFPIPEFLLFVGSAAVSIPFLPGFALKLNLLTLIQFPVQCLVITYFLLHYKWHNFYTGLGPYLLFTSWWVLTRHFFALSSPFYLFLGAFGILLLLAIVSFFPVLFLGSPVYFLYFYGLSRPFFVSVGVVVCLIVLLLLLGKFSRKLMEAKWLNVSFDSLLLLQVLLSIPAILMAASWVTYYYTPTNIPAVTLTQYSEYCGPHNWAGNNMVQTQLDCLHLTERTLMASGRVQAVKIQQVSNNYELSLRSFPGIIRAALTCMLGDLEPMCGGRSDMETCKMEFTGCHFHRTVTYTFAIDLNVGLSPEDPLQKVSVTLQASNSFAEMVKNFTVGNFLEFNATFVSGMGSDQLVLQLVSLNGHIAGRDEESVQDTVQLFVRQVMNSCTNTLALLFDVLLGYTAP